MDFSRDEVRRQLQASAREHDEALPQWREALARTFDPASVTSDRAKRQLLGLPDRRRFLTVGGLTLATSALLAACGDSGGDEQIPVSGTLPVPAEEGVTPTTTPAQGQETDVTLLRTAQSIEVLAVETYQAAIDSGLVTTPAIADAAQLFQAQHREHAALLAETTTETGGEPYDQANEYLFTEVVEPALGVLDGEEGVVSLALTLENTAAQTYVFAAELLTTPDLRQAIMSIGATEARHVSVLFTVQNQPPVPFAFMPRRDAVDRNGYVPQDEPPLTPTTRAPTTTAPAATTGTALPPS
jgi:hypothetical protein